MFLPVVLILSLIFFKHTKVDHLGPMATILYPLMLWHALVRLEFNLAEALLDLEQNIGPEET